MSETAAVLSIAVGCDTISPDTAALRLMLQQQLRAWQSLEHMAKREAGRVEKQLHALEQQEQAA